jgi:nitrogen fixation NifU-like protein
LHCRNRPNVDLRALYREVILEHYKQPRNTAPLWHADEAELPTGAHVSLCKNPSCGDRVTVQLELAGGRISRIAFQGTGCAISQASASMMTEALKGKALQHARTVRDEFRRMVVEGADEAALDRDLLGDLLTLQGVARLHARVKCAMCGWSALDAALAEQREVNLEFDSTLPESSGDAT